MRANTTDMVNLRWASGTVELHGLSAGDPEAPEVCRWDPRAGCYRAPAVDYDRLILSLRASGLEYEDEARRYTELSDGLQVRREPRPYQTEAIKEWRRHRGRGVVVLPTGAGKSYVAMMAIDQMRRSALVIAPTLDLVRQWHGNLRTSFGVDVGVVGGGDHHIEDLTVTTYDSAYIHMEHLGCRFGIVVFDECHHLPGETYALAARLCLAPFRLGLTATPERADGREDVLNELVGPMVYRQEIVEMSGDYLADYETVRLSVELSAEDRERYDKARGVYRAFVMSQGIRMSSPAGWSEFIRRSAMSDAGRRAMKAYREQRHIAFAAPGKLRTVEHLLFTHRADRSIVFTQDNATAYEISRRFLIPAITHQTKVTERSEILEGLAEGRYRGVVTSKVLNEGVDVPDANVAIVVSGSGSVREHVQRLGRVLRKKDGKRATLYELVTTGTSEAFTSERRRITLLTADLVRAYRKGGNLKLSSWRGDARSRALILAESYLAIAEDSQGSSRGELLEAFDELPVGARERKMADGLRKLVLDRCEFEARTEIEPVELRAAVFQEAATVRRESSEPSFDREAILERIGARFETTQAEVERLLYADLKDAHRLLAFRSCAAEALLEEYDLGQVQAVLLRAERIVVEVSCDNPSTYRYLFRKLKFHRLLYRITSQKDGYRIEIDGPFSMFSSVTKYGLQLAMLVPTLRACDRWSLKAELRWGKDRARLSFEASGERAEDAGNDALPDDVQTLVDKLRKRRDKGKSEWDVDIATDIFDLPGVGVCVPDLILSRAQDGVCVYVEVLGYWSRNAVWKRIELVEKGLDQPMVFIVPQRLRVSEEALPPDLPAALYVYKGVIHPKSLEDRLNTIANR